jgi:diguanylate cyclase (GGDEF)-like protein
MGLISRLDCVARALNAEPAFPNVLVAAISATLIVVLVALNGLLPGDIGLEPFYIIGITICTLFGGVRFGLITAITVCAFVAYVNAWHGPRLQMSAELIAACDFAGNLASILIGSALSAWGATLYSQERVLSRTDILTGILNRRGFQMVLDDEIRRQRRARHPLAIAYLDCDNFKEVNDRHGHEEGDTLLRNVAHILTANVRRTDTVARLGGDEFAILLVKTDRAGAERSVEKVRQQLLHSMAEHHWPVTFSIGLVVFEQPPASVDEATRLADMAMYSVKHNGKDGLLIAGNVISLDRGRQRAFDQPPHSRL